MQLLGKYKKNMYVFFLFDKTKVFISLSLTTPRLAISQYLPDFEPTDNGNFFFNEMSFVWNDSRSAENPQIFPNPS